MKEGKKGGIVQKGEDKQPFFFIPGCKKKLAIILFLAIVQLF
jgi:hypothetical protein